MIVIYYHKNFFLSLTTILTHRGSGILSGILFVITAVMINPFAEELIGKKAFSIPKWGAIVILIVGFFAGVLTFPQ